MHKEIPENESVFLFFPDYRIDQTCKIPLKFFELIFKFFPPNFFFFFFKSRRHRNWDVAEWAMCGLVLLSFFFFGMDQF